MNKMCYGNVKVANITGLPQFVTKAKARISIPVFNSWTQNYQKVFFGIFEGVRPDNKFHGQKQKWFNQKNQIPCSHCEIRKKPCVLETEI